MTGAVYAAGHWRRRDPLDGLNPALLAALEDAFCEPLVRAAPRGPWRAGVRARMHNQRTVEAAARRGLLRLRCDDHGQNARYALTVAGLACAQEIQRRAKARAALEPLSRRERVSPKATGEGSPRSLGVLDPHLPASPASSPARGDGKESAPCP